MAGAGGIVRRPSRPERQRRRAGRCVRGPSFDLRGGYQKAAVEACRGGPGDISLELVAALRSFGSPQDSPRYSSRLGLLPGTLIFVSGWVYLRFVLHTRHVAQRESTSLTRKGSTVQ